MADSSLRQKNRRHAVTGNRYDAAENNVAAQPQRPSNRERRPTVAGEQTTAMIKKRLSVRYNAIDFEAPPDVPSLPNHTNGVGQNGRPGPDGQGGFNMDALANPNLQVEQYVSSLLATATEEDINDYQRKLRTAQHRASTDLQHTVYQNRTQFIKISKEAEKLKGEMRILRGLMTELTTTLGRTPVQEVSRADEVMRRRQQRSSVANLEAMYSVQLQTMWKTIEGSQKLIAAIPGRHIVLEQPGWLMLDSATWKPRKRAHLVLLNDYILIAVKKAKRGDASSDKADVKTKLVADKCWPLLDVEVSELSEASRQSRDIPDAITIRDDRDSFTYCRDPTVQQTSRFRTEFLEGHRRTLEDLRRTQKAENEVETAYARTLAKPRLSFMANSPAIGSGIGNRNRDGNETLIDVDGTQRNMQWVEGQIDELDIDIALQRFDQAVAQVEKLRSLAKSLKSNVVAQGTITTKVEERASTLADTLCGNLAYTSSQLSPTLHITTLLRRLNLSQRAQQVYLEARSATLHKLTRQCVFEGNIVSHITSLGVIHFTIIKHTVATYQQCFQQALMSACIVWAKEVMDLFNAALGRTLGGIRKDSEMWKMGIARAKELGADLEEYGLGLGSLIGQGVEG